MARVQDNEYFSPAVRRAIRRERAEQRARYRGRWWFPLLVLLIALSGCWGLLKVDQLLADALIWPNRGAQFVEVGPVPNDPGSTGGRMTIVVGGLNRKSGTGSAAALMPALTVGHTRVFSLIYGSGINDRDILDKFDALMSQYRPREVSFFGSSMGGDVVLNLAAHTQQRRTDYRQALLTGPVPPDPAGPDPAGPDPADPRSPADPADPRSPADPADASSPADSTDPSAGWSGSVAGQVAGAAAGPSARAVGTQAGRIVRLLIATDSRVSARLGTVGVGALIARPPAGESTAAPAGGTSSAAPVTEPQLVPPPRLGTIFLDCSPLSVNDVRDVGRTQADALTGLTEALHTDGGVAVRLTAEMLVQQSQWSTGRFPFLQVRPDDLLYKFNQVWREKIGAPGISTQLIKDQYGVIRRLDIDDIVDTLGPGTRIVYLLPENRDDDHTVRADQVESRLLRLAADNNLALRIVPISGGHHASAEANSDAYRSAIKAVNGGGTG